MGVATLGAAGGGVTAGRGRGVAVGSGSGFGRGLGGISGSGLGVDGRGVVGRGVAGSGVVGGRTGFGLGRGVACGAGEAGIVLISSRALRKARFFCSSVIGPLCCARITGLTRSPSTLRSSKIFRTRRMLLPGLRLSIADLAFPARALRDWQALDPGAFSLQ